MMVEVGNSYQKLYIEKRIMGSIDQFSSVAESDLM